MRPILVPTPTRVVINSEGEATTPRRAKNEYGIEADCVFVRNDGWALGAPFALKETARSLWPTDWTEIWERTNRSEPMHKVWSLINSGGK